MTLTDVPFIGRWLYNRRVRNELRNLLNSSDADWAVKHREWMKVRRSDSQSRLTRDALIDAAVSETKSYTEAHKPYTDTEDSRPFNLDPENHEHPTLPKAS